MHVWVERKPRRRNPSHVVHLDPWLCHTEHERNPSVLGSASHRLYYSNLGGTWASESIISGLEFIFLA